MPWSRSSPFILYSHSITIIFPIKSLLSNFYWQYINVSTEKIWSVGQPWYPIPKNRTNIKPSHHYIAIESHEVPVPIIIPIVHWYYIVIALHYTQLIHDSISSIFSLNTILHQFLKSLRFHYKYPLSHYELIFHD